LILVRCKYNAVFCFSSLNGHCFGAQKLADDFGGEGEAVTVRTWHFGQLPAHVHILELDNDAIEEHELTDIVGEDPNDAAIESADVEAQPEAHREDVDPTTDADGETHE
jgi:GMP synthase-like glutamine amidotransferase